MLSGVEIEVKYLVREFPDWVFDLPSVRVVNGYQGDLPTRVRIHLRPGVTWDIPRTTNDIEVAYLGHKQSLGDPRKRFKDEWLIPPTEALEQLARCGDRMVLKTRHTLDWEGRAWEIDRFHGPLEGLTLAEYESQDGGLDLEDLALPDFLGAEVTGDIRFRNDQLSLLSGLSQLGPGDLP